MARKKLKPAPVIHTLERGTIGWWVKTAFEDWPHEPFIEMWFFTRRGAERWRGRS